jgi:hypothetical protein
MLPDDEGQRFDEGGISVPVASLKGQLPIFLHDMIRSCERRQSLSAGGRQQDELR